jgi:DNA polymerase III alpha subunit (gram-positive type)
MLYTIFDIETTGLSRTAHDIIQFAYINVHPSLHTHSSGYFYLYKDRMAWTEEAEAAHGISRNQLVQYKDQYESNLRKMYVILQKGNLVGHNLLQFDFPFCESYLLRNGMPQLEPLDLIDTMKLYKRRKLSVLAEELNINLDIIGSVAKDMFGEANGAHDGRWDVTATMMIFARAMREGRVTNV